MHSARHQMHSTNRGPRFERQRRRILDAATVLMNESGLWGMTLQEVAAALDLRTSSVTYYFRRRELLAASVFEESLAALAEIAATASGEPTPRRRVQRYAALYFERYAAALRGEDRPFAILSEIRSMDEESRSILIGRYQDIFRTVRGFFGSCAVEDRKRLCTARAHILNEALFWSEVWLRRYAIGDLPKVRSRLLDVLDGGLVNPGGNWRFQPIALPTTSSADEHTDFLQAATRLINDFGYKGASVERITAELNRNRMYFYRSLDGKDELVAACSRESYRRLAELQSMAGQGEASAWQQIATTVGSALSLQFRGDYPLLRSSALQAMPDTLRRTAVEQFERAALSLTGQMVEAMQEGNMRIVDPLIASQFVMSSINAAYDLRGWRSRRPLEPSIDAYMSVIATGLFDPD